MQAALHELFLIILDGLNPAIIYALSVYLMLVIFVGLSPLAFTEEATLLEISTVIVRRVLIMVPVAMVEF